MSAAKYTIIESWFAKHKQYENNNNNEKDYR